MPAERVRPTRQRISEALTTVAAASRRSSVLAQDLVMCRTAGALFLFGGAVNAAFLVSGSGSIRSGAVLAVLSAGTGVWLLFGQRHLGSTLLHFLLGFATLLIAAAASLMADFYPRKIILTPLGRKRGLVAQNE